MKLCTICGEPCRDGRCTAHRPEQPSKRSFRERGYTTAWTKLSARARRLQPWCSDCGTKHDLTGDHLRWPATKLEHVDVVCRPCNSRRGAARTLPTTGEGANDSLPCPRAMANTLTVDRLHTEEGL